MARKPSKLFVLCTSRRWNDAISYVQSRPKEAETLQPTGKRGAAPISPLHIVLAHSKCRGDAPLALIDVLLEAAPHLAAQKHLYTGNQPLHAVFYNPFYSASKRTEIAKRIIAACPQSVKLRNNDGKTPLHTICSQHCNHQPILELLNAAPETASWADKNGDLPIHLACRSLKSPNKSIETLWGAFPESVLTRNEEGLTPLDFAKSQHAENPKNRACLSRLKLLEKLDAMVLRGKCSTKYSSRAAKPVYSSIEAQRDCCDSSLSIDEDDADSMTTCSTSTGDEEESFDKVIQDLVVKVEAETQLTGIEETCSRILLSLKGT